jgi:uncharacterized membrane protein YfcA
MPQLRSSPLANRQIVHLDAIHLVFLGLAAISAGFVDAIAGGGGLIQLPALMVASPTTPIAQILGTNKLSSIFGTCSAAIAYSKKARPDLATALPMAVSAFIGAAAGASVATRIPTSFFKPIILVLLVVVGLYTWRKPNLGEVEALRYSGRRHTALATLVGLVIGFYDGLFGPGTGTFLIFALVGLLGYAFLKASATAKIVNVGTNAAALLVFGYHGAIFFGLGFFMAACNVTGAVVGARLAIRGGSVLIRKVFLGVLFLLVLRLAWDTFHG